MIPYPYNMVDMGGIDLAEANGTVVEGLYAKIVEAVNACGDVVLYNWKFAGIEIAPQHTTILLGETITINGAIQVTEQDAVTVPGINPILDDLSVTENGIYFPQSPVDGFSSVDVHVNPTLAPLSVTEDGIYLPQSPAVGFSSVEVDVAQDVRVWNENILCNWDFNNVVNTRGQDYYTSGYGFDGWGVYQGSVIRRNGGISIIKSPSFSFMLSGQTLYRPDAAGALFGKTITISALVGDEFGSYTFTASSTGSQDQGRLIVDGLEFYFYRDSLTQMPFYMFTDSSDNDEKIIRAVKAEFGSVSTLATLVDGEWVLNKTGDQVTEYFRVREAVKNS